MRANISKKVKDIPYIERDVSWLRFNRRLLCEASRDDLPLLERFNYLGIYSNNLDEFFRVRIASLRRLADGDNSISQDEQVHFQEILKDLLILYKSYSLDFEEILAKLMNLLEGEHIHILNDKELTPEQEEEVRSFYMNTLSGSANPIFLDSPTFHADIHLKESLYLLVILSKDSKEENALGKENNALAVVEIPSEDYGRFISLKSEGKEDYMMFLDDVLRYSFPYVFAGLDYNTYSAYTFKLTKDAEMDMERDLRQSVIEKVAIGVKQRRKGEPIRLVYDEAMPSFALEKLAQIINIDMEEMSLAGGRYHNMKDLMHLPDFGKAKLRFPKQSPLLSSEISYSRSILEQILDRDIGIHFPYESFDHFLRILREAAINPDVEEIKVSLYRVAQHSKVIKALMSAAQNGKRVVAVVELLARFDERSNIKWSKRMQEAGVEVILGHEKLKIHAKLVLIKLRNKRSIACIGSGNLHEGTAKLYTDYMLLTSHKGITDDVDDVFRFIEYPYLNIEFKELLVAPNDLRKRIYALIKREIRNAQRGKEAYIKMKLNHIVDKELVSKLYEAVQAGVNVELCLRGNCSLIPNVQGISEGLFINGVIDRYLEHSRIYIFANGGDPRYYLGSADWMPRNLDRRIEVMCPIYAKNIQEELEMIVDYGLSDTANGYYVNENNGLPRRELMDNDTELFSSQANLYRYYQTIHTER